MGLFAKLLSKDFPSTAAALAMGKIALDSEGLERGQLSFEKLTLALE